MEYSIKEMGKKRMWEVLESYVKTDREFQKKTEQYHSMMVKLQKKLDMSEEDNRKFLECLSNCNNFYGESAYTLGFYDGLDLGLEHGRHDTGYKTSNFSVEDMTELIYIHDAYKALNKSVLGEEMILGFHEGILGTLGRIYKVIGNHVSEELNEGDYPKEHEILADTSLEPEERAKQLLGI